MVVEDVAETYAISALGIDKKLMVVP